MRKSENQKSTLLLQLEEHQLNRLFPYYLLIDKTLTIIQCSANISRICTNAYEASLLDIFSVADNGISIVNFDKLLHTATKSVTLSHDKLILNGHFECVNKPGELLFVGSPVEQISEAIHISSENQIRLHNYFDSIADNIWEHDVSTGITKFSKRQSELLGSSDIRQTDNVKLWWSSIHPEDKPMLEENDCRYKAGLIDKHTLEYRLLCKDGSVKWVLDRGVVVEKNDDGKPLKIIGTHTEVTSIKQAEIAVRESELRFRSLSENLNDGIIVEDENRHIIQMNQKFCDMFAISFRPKALNGMSCKDTVRYCAQLVKDPGDFESLIEELIQKKKNVSSIILELKDGKIYEMDCIPIFIDNQYKGHVWKYADVTERIHADNKLEAQKKFYEDVLNGIPADIAVLNENREYLYVNPYAIKDEELRKWMVGKKDEDFCQYRNKPMDIAAKRKELFYSVKDTRQQIEWEEKNVTREGKPLHYLRKLYPVLNNNGNVKFMIGYGIDITERKKFEDQLIISEKRYRDLFNFGQALICTHDLMGKIISINPATRKLLEYEEHEMVGQFIYDFIPDEDKLLFAEKYIVPFNNTDNVKGVFCVVSKSGNKIYLLYQNYKVQEPGREAYIIGFSQDITERKKTEELIRRGEEKYRSIIENMNLGMVELNTESTIIFANENLSKMSGYGMDELIGKKLYNVFSERQSRHFIKQKMYLKEKGVSEVYEFVVKNKKGETRWWLVSGAPLHTNTGELKGSLAICLDITSQKVLELELRHAKQQAEQSASIKESFLANMSHEIRTPMNAILGMGKQLEKTVMDGQQKFFLTAMNSAASNLLVIINDILDFSKIEAGKMSLHKVGFELGTITKKALQVVLHKAEEKGLALSAVIDPNIAPVLIGDPHRINQVLINLLGNSVKFTEKGRVSIHCRVAEDSGFRQLVYIEVVDSGIGMSEEFQKSLFDKFLQEDDKNGKKYSGTGLGMSIVKELVALMKGTIKVESKKNVGTVVSLEIPFEKGSIDDLPKKEEKIPGSNILFNKRILLVEDNEMNRMLAILVLNQFGAIVDEAFNGEEAIAAMQTNEYDLVLMDMRMPVMDGLEATQIIRKKLSSTIPIIALTANAISGEEQKCLEAGMNDFLIKPFEEEHLVQIIARWLGIQNVFQKKEEKEMPGKSTALFCIDNLKNIGRGNKDFIAKMLSIFVREMSLALQEISAAEQLNDIEKIKSVAHRIKPSLSNMEVGAIKEDILQLEVFNLAGSEIAQLPEIINRVEHVITEVISQVNQLISSGEY